MFDTLTQKLDAVFKRLRGHGRLTEADVQEALREVRLSLLEADVHFKVVREFVEQVRARATGQEVRESLTPAQQVIKIVHEELTRLMGEAHVGLDLAGRPPHLIMLVGLQGSGKTTTAGKLAALMRSRSRNPLLVPADVRRPAAIEQLKRLGAQLNLPVYPATPDQTALQICQQARRQGEREGQDVLLLDTAGRLHIDEPMMAELAELARALMPQEILLVADAMGGQDAVNVARRFSETLPLTGIILTKLDGDARGGAALSMRAVTGRPIKFVGVGEKLDALEPFHPDRMAARILGMGDVLTLIEKAQATFDKQAAEELERKLRKQTFTLEDFRDQLRQVRQMGSLEQLVSMIPGVNKLIGGRELEAGEQGLKHVDAVINSMTREERQNPAILNASRRRRIARGSGTSVEDVNRLIKQYQQLRRMMAELGKGRFRRMRGLGPF